MDDEPGIALLCKRMLTRGGYLVAALTDPREASEWLKQNKADLLLVDIRMPEVDGFEVIASCSQPAAGSGRAGDDRVWNRGDGHPGICAKAWTACC